MTESADGQQKPHLFQKGQSGNPAGRRPGSRHKATLAALALLEGESEALTRKAVEAALGGDMTALRLCLERIVPVAKDRPVNVKLPVVETAADLPKITAAILAAASSGRIGTTEAAALARLVDAHRGALEIADIEARLRKLELEVNDDEK